MDQVSKKTEDLNECKKGMRERHTSVFKSAVIDFLNVHKTGRYIDATYGEGGHSKEIINRGAKVLAIDWDDKFFNTRKEQASKEGIKIVQGNFKDIEKIAQKNNFANVHGVLFDLGLSMRQIASSARGFSYKRGSEPLDMRINTAVLRTAADIVNSCPQEYLYEIFSRYAEEVNSRSISDSVVRARRLKKIRTVSDLVDIIEKKTDLRKQEKVLARIFQALRIEVNNEFDNIKTALKGAFDIVLPGGRIVILTFHPGEDRIVKAFIRKNKSGLKAYKKIIKDRKKFERSAQLRAIEKNEK